ncbi:Protein NLRC5 [Holothuria leucospilota]|uniref:Protein NLRC5 n=1 Tax=Holothuria leucospilota TaxID=206669 RepID=A0A9Q1CFR1_HOLLE|nr:Protein NLRC5 [Holothuria leucospilota]
MGNLWSYFWKATVECVPDESQTGTNTVRNAGVEKITDVPHQTEVDRCISNEDFSNFLGEVGASLSKYQARLLATGFDFSPSQMELIETSNEPGHVFLRFARDKGIISSSDISAFIYKLEVCDLHGVATQVNEIFRRYQDKASSNQSVEHNEKRRAFVTELKCKYENQYEAVQPIPYIRDRLLCVKKVFVEGGIEYLVAKKGFGGENWDGLSSYQDIFKDSRVISSRRILEGNPGYGKSTVTLQIAYDWCNSTRGSYLDKFEILILLRLRQLRGVTSIYSAIKRFILPKDSVLTEGDVKHILQNSSSVLVVLDGFDEYSDQDSKLSDVSSIIQREMFQQFDVIVTTRTAYLPKHRAPHTKRIRLTGFNEEARDEYIRKAVVGNDDAATIKIKRQLDASSVLAEVCEVPLLFVMFAHMSHESNLLEKYNSVTHFFGHMMGCFYHHLENKMKDDNVPLLQSFEEAGKKLAKVAFEGLRGKRQLLVWEKSKMCEQLGKNCYDMYVRLGILVEEEVLDIFSGFHAGFQPIHEKTEVRFYHKLFCEWFAAHHLSDCVGSIGGEKPLRSQVKKKAVGSILKEFDPFDLQYLFRFTCGLNADAAQKIITYLKGEKTTQKLAVLCVLEQEGDIQRILGSLKDLCSNKVQIGGSDTKLLQRSTIDLLKIASDNSVIFISCVYLHNCYITVDLRGRNDLLLKSTLSIPVLTTLEMLWIDERGREVTEEEFSGILLYSSKCLALKDLRFRFCLLPQSVQAESVSVPRSRNVKVTWYPSYTAGYQLNLNTGLWERTARYGGGLMSDEDYQTEVNSSRRWRETLTVKTLE